MLSTTDNTIPFDKAIEEIDAIAKLAGLSGWYSFGDRKWDNHHVEVFLASPAKVAFSKHTFSPTGDDDEDEDKDTWLPDAKKAIMDLACDDFTHLNGFMAMFAMYLIKVSWAVKNPSPMFDASFQQISDKLLHVATSAAAKFTGKNAVGKSLHKDEDMQHSADLLRDLSKVFLNHKS